MNTKYGFDFDSELKPTDAMFDTDEMDSPDMCEEEDTSKEISKENKNRLSKLSRSSYGPQKLHRKK